MKTKIRVKDDATEAVGCVPYGAPHIHAGTCGEYLVNPAAAEVLS